jgi:hypothetical protein
MIGHCTQVRYPAKPDSVSQKVKMKKLFVLLFAFGVFASNGWAETCNIGFNVFGFVPGSAPYCTSTINWLGPRDGYRLSFGVFVGVGVMEIVEDSNQPPTEDNPNFTMSALVVPLAARLGYHFIPDNEKIDIFTMITAGYFFSFGNPVDVTPDNYSARSNAERNKEYNPDGWLFLEAGAGIRYFFLSSFGIYGEIGFNPVPIITNPLFSLCSVRIDFGVTVSVRTL